MIYFNWIAFVLNSILFLLVGMLNSIVQFVIDFAYKVLLPPAEYQQLQKDYAKRRQQTVAVTPLHNVTGGQSQNVPGTIKANNLLLDPNLSPDVTYEFSAAVKP